MIRLPAATKLARQLFELRVSRVTPIDNAFYELMAKMIQVYVEGDEQAQRTEKLMEKQP